MRKKIYILLVAPFLEDRHIISWYKYFCGKNGGRGNFFWKHWEGRLMWKGKFTYTYTLLIIQYLCNDYSSTQKINEAKVNNVRNKTHTHVFDNRDEGLWAESQTPSEFKSKSDKKVRQGSIGNMKVKKTCLYASFLIHTVWVYIITSTQVVKKWERKYTCSLLQLS